MNYYCLTHSHEHGISCYLFRSRGFPEQSRVIGRLGVDVSDGDDIIVGEVETKFLPNLGCHKIPYIEE